MKTFFNRHRFILLAGIVYILLAGIYSFNVLAKSSDHLVGADHLGSLSYWTSWWIPYAIQHNFDLVQTNYTLYPIEANILPLLSVVTSFFYNVADLFLPSLLAYNLLFPVYFVLNGVVTATILWNITHHRVAALIGSAIVVINPLAAGLVGRGELPLLGWFVFGLYILVLQHFWGEQPKRWRVPLLIATFYGIVLMSTQYLNLLLTFAIPYTVYYLWKHNRAALRQIDFLTAVLGMQILFAVYPLSMYIWSTFPIDYVNENALTSETTRVPEGEPTYKSLEYWQGQFDFHTHNWTLFLIILFVVIFLALIVIRGRILEKRFWFAIVVCNSLLVLHPEWSPLTILAKVFSLRFAPVSTAPALYFIPVLYGASILVGYALENASRRLSYGSVVVGLPLILILSTFDFEIPMSLVPEHPYMEQIANDPETLTILEIPVAYRALADEENSSEGVSLFPELAGQYQSYMPVHHKRLIGGFVSHYDLSDLEAYRSSYLMRVMTFQPIDVSPEEFVPILKTEILRWRVGYVVINPDIIPPEFMESVRGWMRWTNTFCPIANEQGTEYWRATWHPAGCPEHLLLELGGSAGDLAVQNGWEGTFFDEGVLARPSGVTSSLLWWVDYPRTDYTLTITARSSETAEQTVEVFANSVSLGTVTLSLEYQSSQLTLPRELTGEGGKVQLTFQHSESNGASAAFYQSIELDVLSRE